MAKFEKTMGQSSKGWDPRAGQHVVTVGSDIEITLTGSDADALTVTSSDTTLCTIHERKPAAPAGGKRIFVVTALKAGDCKIEARTKGRQVMAWFQTHITASKHPIKLVFFPGERVQGGVTTGTIYVVGGNGERFKAAGGAPAAYKDKGGHTSDPTPPGRYVLGSQHHVTTGTWPNSAIPWGSRIRILLSTKQIEFESPGKVWLPVTGPNGVVIKYMKEFAKKDGKNRTWQDCDAELRNLLIDHKTGWLRTAYWDLNDFGRWGWNMTKNGAITPFYVHTTPIDELATAQGKQVNLTNSHGCVHITPTDRDKMMSLGYLKRGVELEVRRYSEVGPP